MKKFLLLALLLGGYSAHGFTLNSSSDSNVQGWAGHSVTFLVNASNCPASIDIPGLIGEAYAVWNNVPTSNIKVSYGGSTTSTTYASSPTVYCETNFQSVLGADQNYVPGAASVTPPSPGGNIASAVLYLNVSSGNANIANFDHTKLTIILAHEIGHILGLGHSQDSSALMYYNASAKNNLRLAQDDIDGINYLYPRNELGSDRPAGCGRIGSPPRRPPGFLIFLAGFMLLPLSFCLWLRYRH